MITIRRTTESGLETVERPTSEARRKAEVWLKGCWMDVTDPGLDEAGNLAQDLNIPLRFVIATLDPHEIPRIEKVDEALFILVRIPHPLTTAASIPYMTLPLAIIVTNEWVMTICRREHDLLRDLPPEHQIELSTADLTRFVLHLLWNAANSYIHHLGEINEIVDQIEERLQRSLQNREVLELLRYQKSLVHFTTALRANELMLEWLQRSEFLELEQKDKVLLDAVFTENRQAMAATGISSDILSQMMDAFASIISNNLNVVMKFLASAAVILVVPTIIGTFYGMNVHLPLEDNPFAFLMLVGLSTLSSTMIGLILWRRGWL
jgi:magnesium transporter